MGFYIRKSVRVGPLRFNLSKSGIGVSTGIPGLRVGTGPRGTYVHMGRGGLYYRQTISTPKSQRPELDRPELAPTEPAISHGPMHMVGSRGVSGMVDSTSAALLAEIDTKRKRTLLWPFALAGALVLATLLVALQVSVWITAPITLVLAVGVFFAYQYDQLKKSVVLMYELDGSSLTSFQGLFNAINEIKRCGAAWHITAQGDVYDPKYHAGAGQLINRQRLLVDFRSPPYVKTNISVPHLRFGNHSLYLLPDRILVYAEENVGAVDYVALNLSSSPTRFIEQGSLPHDAKVVDHTWRYVNKSGGPDRRFSNNSQIPICQYEELQITTASGIREIIQLSRLGVSEQLKAAVAEAVDGIREAEAAERQRKTVQTERNQNTPAAHLESREIHPTVSSPPPTPEMLHTALFEILCCVMVADGRASSKERLAIRDIMSKVKSGWSEDECDGKISSFIDEIQKQGYSNVLRRSMSQLKIIKQVGREGVLLKSIEMIGEADGEFSARERALYDQIRQSLGLTS